MIYFEFVTFITYAKVKPKQNNLLLAHIYELYIADDGRVIIAFMI